MASLSIVGLILFDIWLECPLMAFTIAKERHTHGEQKFVYWRQRFTIYEVVLAEEFLRTTKITFGQELTINKISYKQGCTKWSLL